MSGWCIIMLKMSVLRTAFRRPRSMVTIRMMASNSVKDSSQVEMIAKDRRDKSNKMVSMSRDSEGVTDVH